MNKPPYVETGQADDAIILGRCLYLTRNLEEQVFTAAMTTRQSEVVKAMLTQALLSAQTVQFSDLEEKSIKERHEQLKYMNQGILMTDPLKFNLEIGILESKDGQLGASMNDVDHLRYFCRQSNKNFEALWSVLDLMDDEIGMRLAYAYQEPFGYLTSRLENLGTGLVGEAILHLPALQYTGFIESLAESVGAIGVQIKPLKGTFYKVSNSVTLGRREIEIVTLLDQVVSKLVEREIAGRETLLASNPNKWKDRVGRAYGAMTYASLLEEEEALSWLSDLLLGIGFGFIVPSHSIEQAFSQQRQWLLLWQRLLDQGMDGYVGRVLRHSERALERAKILQAVFKHWQWRR